MAVTSLTRNSIVSPTKYTDFLAGNHQYDVSSMIPIATINATGSQSDLTFNNIPQNYQDLYLVGSLRGTNASVTQNINIIAYYSGYPATVQSTTRLFGDGAGAGSNRYTNQDTNIAGEMPGASATAGIYASLQWHMLNYANSTTYKTTLSRIACDRNGSGTTFLTAGLARYTGAITTINLSTFSGSVYFAAGSTVTLYGIKTVGQ